MTVPEDWTIKEILDALHRFSFGHEGEIERTDISFFVEQIRDEMEFMRTVIIVADMERMDGALQFMRERKDIWDAGRTAVIEHASKHVDDDGMIDQHVVAIGGSKLRNPYDRSG